MRRMAEQYDWLWPYYDEAALHPSWPDLGTQERADRLRDRTMKQVARERPDSIRHEVAAWSAEDWLRAVEFIERKPRRRQP